MLSNSGETDELLELLPFLKRRNVPLVAIVGNLTSTIAQRADAVVDASVDQEACPLNLAPTTSTTVALALGDALAMALMGRKRRRPSEKNKPLSSILSPPLRRGERKKNATLSLPIQLSSSFWFMVMVIQLHRDLTARCTSQ